MKKLEINFKKNGFNYDQVYRDEDFAIYKQTDKDDSYYLAYEVFKINKNQEWIMAGNIIPASETVPPSTQWGNNAFTFHTLEAAYKKLNEMKQKITV